MDCIDKFTIFDTDTPAKKTGMLLVSITKLTNLSAKAQFVVEKIPAYKCLTIRHALPENSFYIAMSSVPRQRLHVVHCA
jgi:hypothetical protein